MNQTIEEIQSLSHGEIAATLAALAPQVLEAHDRYKALVAEQRLYLAARTLNEHDLRMGEKVQMRGTWAGKKDPFAIVLEPGSYLMFQVLRKDGQPHGEPQPLFMFGGFEKI